MDCGLVAGAHRQMLMMLINTSVWTGVCHNDFPIPMRTCGSMIIGARTCVHMAGAKQLDEYEHAWRHLSTTGAGRHERRMRQTARGLLMQESATAGHCTSPLQGISSLARHALFNRPQAAPCMGTYGIGNAHCGTVDATKAQDNMNTLAIGVTKMLRLENYGEPAYAANIIS